MQQHVHSIAITCGLLGIKHVVISPGSRSAPLVLAFAHHKKFIIHTAIDERSAAYMALGMAQQKQKPVVLICTSGTAAANYYPAVAEAFYQKIPLLLLTADRPNELLDQQDGQMINQQNLYGHHVRGFYQLNCYSHGSENHRETTALISEAIGKCSFPAKGPVHVNVPLKEPLYPNTLITKDLVSLERSILKWLNQHIYKAIDKISDKNFSQLEQAWVSSTKKMILIGQSVMHEKWITPLFKLKEQGDVVILADVASNKHAMANVFAYDKLISAANPQTLKNLAPDLLISFGGPVLSKSLKNWLKQQQPQWHFRIQQEPEMVNTYGNVTHVLKAGVDETLQQIAEITWIKKPDTAFVDLWKNADEKITKKITNFLSKPQWSEMHVTNHILKQISDCTNLQLSNSSMVRYVSWLANLNPSWIINSNRGTSGIDGCTSTAIGAAKVNLRPTVLLTGDLAFLYDKNAFWINNIPKNIRVVVFNNGGGGIFSLIDGPTKHKQFTHLFTTPHQRSVKSVATDNGLDYYFCNSYSKLNKIIQQFFEPTNGPAVLELKFDMKTNAKIFEAFKKIKL
jgi:2-succinyl-5-enolpyruvyl-6-hydroxy-3-cyclohexene-1-carboxylate synthase